MGKFVEAIVAVLFTVALVGSGALPLWGNILVIIACIGALYAIFKN